VKEFAGDSNVAFGDVNLAEDQIRGNHNPGAGGWPTIRYFNQDTGYGGAAYEQKTGKSMCDELGDMEYLRAYVRDKTPSCMIDDPSKGCGDKEVEFIKKWSDKNIADVSKELNRLNGMKSAKLAPDLLRWQRQRLGLLRQFEKKLQSAGTAHAEL